MNVLISAPSLDPRTNVSGISSVVQNVIIAAKPDCLYHHFQVGKSDKENRIVSLVKLTFSVIRYPYSLLSNKIDIAHQNIPFDRKGITREFLFVLIATCLRIPVLAHIHGGELLLSKSPDRLTWLLAKILLHFSSSIIVLGQIEKGSIIKQYGIQGEKIIVLPNAVICIPEHKNVVCEKTPLNLLFIGRFDERKGLNEIAIALNSLTDQLIPYRFSLCGDGDYQSIFVSALQSEARANVNFLGVVSGDSKTKVYLESDVLCLPSYFEGLPMSLLEAMSFGLVPITTGVGSIPEVVISGVNGLIIPIKNSEAIVNSIISLHKNRQLLLSMSNAAKKTIDQKYNMKSYADKLFALYSTSIR